MSAVDSRTAVRNGGIPRPNSAAGEFGPASGVSRVATVPDLRLFRDDSVERLLTELLPKPISRWGRTAAVFVLILSTWATLAVLTHSDSPMAAARFLGDYAAVAQFLVAIPILVAGERFLDDKTSAARIHLIGGGVLGACDGEDANDALQRAWAPVSRMNSRTWPYALLGVLASTTSWGYIVSEILGGATNWRMVDGRLTWAGWWMTFLALPAFHFLWMRWATKMLLWTWFLKRLSSARLIIDTYHPDGAGGVAFLGSVQAAFGVLIFSFGAVTTATALYNIHVVGTDPEGFLGLGLILIYTVCAPALFVAPLLYFTRPLREAKVSALHQCAEASRRLRAECLAVDLSERAEKLINLRELYRTLDATRTLPFDFATLRSLVFSAITPVAPLLVQLVPRTAVRLAFERMFASG